MVTPRSLSLAMVAAVAVVGTATAAAQTTVSQVHEVAIGTWTERTLARRWSIAGGVDVSPRTLARLTTILPEKYPGQENPVPGEHRGADGAAARHVEARTLAGRVHGRLRPFMEL